MARQIINYRDNTDEVLSALEKAKHNALEAIGLTAERHAKKACPLYTGLLRNSITYVVSGYQTHVKDYRRANVEGGTNVKHERYAYGNEVMDGEKDSAVYIGTNVEYAPYVELGTSRSSPKPFLKPAATEHSAEYKRIMKAAMKTAE